MEKANSSKKEKSQEVLAFEIAVPVKKIPRSAMYLNQDVGSGQHKGKKFQVHMTIPGHSIIVEVDDQRYKLELTTMVELVLNAHK